MYGTIRPAAIRTLIGAEHHENGAMFFRTLACLPALVGAWRDRGGGFARSVGVWSELGRRRHTRSSRPDLLGDRQPRWVNMSRLGEILTETDRSRRSRRLMVWGCNPMVIAPNSRDDPRRGLLRDDLFTVVHEQFMTDTARYADIVLPATTQIEGVDVVTPWGHLYLGWNEPAIEPLWRVGQQQRAVPAAGRGDGLHRAGAVRRRHDRAFAIRCPASTSTSCARWVSCECRIPTTAARSATACSRRPVGKVELVQRRVGRAWANRRCRRSSPPVESTGWRCSAASASRSQLLTPKQHTRFLNSSYSHLPGHGPLEGGPFVELSPATPRSSRHRRGSVRAEVFNDRASVDVPATITERVRPGRGRRSRGVGGAATTPTARSPTR